MRLHCIFVLLLIHLTHHSIILSEKWIIIVKNFFPKRWPITTPFYSLIHPCIFGIKMFNWRKKKHMWPHFNYIILTYRLQCWCWKENACINYLYVLSRWYVKHNFEHTHNDKGKTMVTYLKSLMFFYSRSPLDKTCARSYDLSHRFCFLHQTWNHNLSC